MNHSYGTAQVAVLVAAEPEDDRGVPMPWMRRLCRAAARHLPASGVGVSVLDEGGVQEVAAASDEHCERVEELQLVLGEGPCLDAFTARRPVLVGDLRHEERWSAFSPAALAQGVHAVFAFPLQVGVARLGVLDVYRSVSGPLAKATLAQAISFAELAVDAFLDGQERAAPGAVGADLGDALENRAEIYQAQGMVMVDLGVSLAEAMSRLRAHAFAHDRRLGAVAHDVVSGRLVLPTDGP